MIVCPHCKKGFEPILKDIYKWIAKLKGKAKEHKCEMEDKTCIGIMNWSNKSQKYLREESDWQVLCKGHYMRYDINMIDSWKKNLSHPHTKETKEKISKTKKGQVYTIKSRRG